MQRLNKRANTHTHTHTHTQTKNKQTKNKRIKNKKMNELFPDIKRSSKEKAKGLMKNNPLKPDDYNQQLYALPKLMHIK